MYRIIMTAAVPDAAKDLPKNEPDCPAPDPDEDIAEVVGRMTRHRLWSTYYTSVKDRFPGWEGAFLLDLIPCAYGQNLVEPHLGMRMNVPLFDNKGKPICERHELNKDREQPQVVNEYRDKVILKGMMVILRGTPMCTKRTMPDGSVMWLFLGGGGP